MSLYCRFCADIKYLQEVTNITSQLRNDLLEKMKVIKIDSVDFTNKILPEIICNTCYNDLNTSYDFSMKVEKAQRVLYDIFTNEKKVDFFDYSDNLDDNSSVKLEDSLSECDDNKHKSSSLHLGLWSSYEWTCGHCNLRFNSFTSVRDHCKVDHTICCSWQCTDCLQKIDEYEDFIKHIRTHRSELVNYCEFCNLKLEDGHSHINTNQPYCKFCGETFDSSERLFYHHNQYQKSKDYLCSQIQQDSKDATESWRSYLWACKYCDMILSSLEILRDHSKQVHGKCFGLKCADCNVNLNNFEEFVEHVRGHREYLRYHCQYCNSSLTDAKHLEQHSIGSSQCDSCGELFQYKRDLRTHISKYRKTKRRGTKKEKEITEQDLTCNSCGKYAKSLKSLKSHLKLHTERKRDYTCDRCGKTFFTKAALSAHNIIHQNPDPQVCKICKKTFLTLTRLKKHIKTHYNERPFRCEVCHKCFRLKEHLKSHAVTHTDHMPYHCQYCEKSFKHRNVLKIHEYQHTGTRPYSCEICNMYFANWSNCNKHLKRKHGTTLAKNVMTPQGKLPINPKTGKPKKLKDLEMVKDWTESVMAAKKGWNGITSAES